MTRVLHISPPPPIFAGNRCREAHRPAEACAAGVTARRCGREEVISVSDPYIMGYSDAYLRILSSRSAAEACGYLMPHLKLGLRVLDVGCGPGSISAGLAKAKAPGELRGIDIEPSQVEMASQMAAEWELSNAEFSVGDVKDIPFEDDSFAVVHCNDLLAFIPDTEVALSEMKRVLKSGGVIGWREIIIDHFMIHPDPDPSPLTRGFAVFADLLEAEDGHPQMGKELAEHLGRAGFTDIRLSASFEMFAGPERMDLLYDLGEQWYFTPDIQTPATQYGAANQRMLDAIKLARDRFRSSTEGFGAFAFGEALAVKP